MALSDDQKAMLRLLAQREQGYEDIAALMGLSVDEVRAKVKDALAELDEAGAAAPPEPPPAPEPPAPPPEPKAEPTPEAPEPAPSPKPEAPKPKPAAAGRPALKLPEDKGALRALIAGGAVVLVIVVLLATGALGGDDDGSEPSSAGEGSAAGATARGTGGQVPTEAVLEPVGGGDASGRALFGRASRNVVLLLRADGLAPSPRGRSYTVSLVRSAEQRLPLVATKVGRNGVINGRFQVAPQVLGLLASGFDEMEVSLVDDDALRVALAQARKTQDAPAYGGVEVLRGDVTGPIVEAGEEG